MTLPVRRAIIRPSFASIADTLQEEFANKGLRLYENIDIDIRFKHTKEYKTKQYHTPLSDTYTNNTNNNNNIIIYILRSVYMTLKFFTPIANNSLLSQKAQQSPLASSTAHCTCCNISGSPASMVHTCCRTLSLPGSRRNSKHTDCSLRRCSEKLTRSGRSNEPWCRVLLTMGNVKLVSSNMWNFSARILN